MTANLNFVEVASPSNNDADAVSEKQETPEMTPIENLQAELDDDGIESYRNYEVVVDTGRFVSKLIEATGNEAYSDLLQKVMDDKAELRSECKKLPGNLPMFRAAFPVSEADDVWVLPSEEAADVGIDYDNEDHIVLPVVDGENWHPTKALGLDHTEGADTFMEADDSEAVEDEPEPETDDNDFVVACKNAKLDPAAVDAALEGHPVPSEGTVEDLKETLAVFVETGDKEAILTLQGLELANDNRKTGLAAIDAAYKAVVDSEENAETVEDEDEAVEQPEAQEADSVEAAKVEALKALTDTLNKTAEAIQSL